MARFGYYADLRGLQFSEGDKPKSWIMAMRVGEYFHPAYGKINFTADRIKRFADSVKQKVRGIALDIDYDHKADPARGNEAAGWVEDAKVEGDALYLLVEWTKTAAEKIKDGAYRYFSPEFQDEWKRADGMEFRDVLFGGGITNRPFLKDLLPVNLSELTFAEKKNEGKGMDLKELRKLYGLPEDGSQDDSIYERARADREAATTKGAAVDRTATTHAPNTPAQSPGRVGGVPLDATTAGNVDKDGNAITGDDVQLSELAKTNPAIRLLLAERAENNRRFAELETAKKVSDIRVRLNEYRTGQTILAPAIVDEAAKLLAKLPTQLHEDLHGLLKLVQGGNTTVQLGEIGHATGPSAGTAKSAEDAVDTATNKKMSEAKAKGEELSYADAMTAVFAEDPKLFTDYQNASYAFRI